MRKSQIVLEIYLLVLIWMLTSCNKPNNMESVQSHSERMKLNELSESVWDSLSNTTIYFGHQSVGSNIIAGIEDVLKDNPEIKLNIKSYDADLKQFQSGLYHERVGLNTKPSTKIEGFCNSLDSGVGEKMDMAFFKFCYVDFNSSTNVSEVFNEYKQAIEKYTAKFPELKILHITAPLRVKPKGLKGMINKLRGKDQNKKRCKYNELLLQEYGTENVFNLAYFESAYEDGTRERDGNVYALIPEYTDDGGHLNMKGRRVIAGQLLIFLATVNTD